jgi:arylsulfatase A-like enzyme
MDDFPAKPKRLSPIDYEQPRSEYSSMALHLAGAGHYALIAVFLLIFMTVPGCERTKTRAVPVDNVSHAAHPNIILITLDTLRADHMSLYGYRRQTTPYIDELAGSAAVFTAAYSTSSGTAPAMASLVTSLHPETHRIVDGIDRDGEIVRQKVLPQEVTVLAEALRDSGYTTFGVTGNGHLTASLGFAQGFDHYTCLGFAPNRKVKKGLADWADAILNAEPYFVWVHFIEPHAPYYRRLPWISSYFPGYQGMCEATGVYIDEESRENPGNCKITSDYRIASYDSEVNFTDESVHFVLTTLRASLDDLVIVTADHGEQLFDHGQSGHSNSVFQEEVRVPLLIRMPAEERREIHQPVSLVDVAPTILESIGIERPRAFQGRSLLKLIHGQSLPPRPAFMSLERGPHRLFAVVRGDWKLIEDVRTRTSTLYDLREDPKERIDLREAQLERAKELAELRRAFESENNANRLEPDTRIPSSEEQAALREMGYLE